MNAFDAVTDGKAKRREVTVRISSSPPGWTKVTVRDSGSGIDPAVAQGLFEPFVTTKRDGMGLGLFVTRSIIESHGGRIWSAANVDGGTTFNFTLPTWREKSTEHSAEPE